MVQLMYYPPQKKEPLIQYTPLSDPLHPTAVAYRRKIIIIGTTVVLIGCLGFLTFIHFLHKVIESGVFEDEGYSQFEDFLQKFNKTYSKDEKRPRYLIYRRNMDELGSEAGVTYAETKFADWTEEELKKILTDRPASHNVNRTRGRPVFYPRETDWTAAGKVTPVKDQGNCGSCWAFAVVAAVESQFAIWRGEKVELSEQELIDCDAEDDGCDGGYRPYGMAYVEKNGLHSEAVYPYDEIGHRKCKRIEKKKYYIDDYTILEADEEAIAQWVAYEGPVTFGMKVPKKMFHYRGGVFNPSEDECEEKSLGSHAMTIVGYGVERGRKYWLVKNSWGRRWGEGGYLKLARGVNACGAEEFVVAATVDSPSSF